MSVAAPSRTTTPLVPVAGALAALTALKFLWILADEGWDPSRAPWFFLAALTVPFALLTWRVARGGTLAVAVLAVACLALAGIVANYVLANGLDAAASDVPVIWLGGPLAAVGFVLSIRSLLARRRAH